MTTLGANLTHRELMMNCSREKSRQNLDNFIKYSPIWREVNSACERKDDNSFVKREPALQEHNVPCRRNCAFGNDCWSQAAQRPCISCFLDVPPHWRAVSLSVSLQRSHQHH